MQRQGVRQEEARQISSREAGEDEEAAGKYGTWDGHSFLPPNDQPGTSHQS